MFFRSISLAIITLLLSASAQAESARVLSYQFPKNDSGPNNFKLAEIPDSFVVKEGKAVFEDSEGREITLTIDPVLQDRAEKLLQNYKPPYGAIVMMDPQDGRILAAAGSSKFGIKGQDLIGRATFPAASLFKVITGAAGVEKGGLRGSSIIAFRGGDHTLSQGNYLPDVRLDRRRMSLADAMGKSCNAVFARLALNSIRPEQLKEYAERFGFNSNLRADFPVQTSLFDYGVGLYDLARTGAGFRGAKISPLHAAVVASTVANGGELLKPRLIDEVRNENGEIIYGSSRTSLGRAVSLETARELNSMMRETTTTGTARRHFKKSPTLSRVGVAGKTGTLKGDNPEGLYHWFIGLAPMDKPEVAIAAVTIDRGGSRISASGLASLMLDRHFGGNSELAPAKTASRVAKKAKRAKVQKTSKVIKAPKKSTKRVSKVRGRA